MESTGTSSLLQDFVVESLEMIDEIEPHLVALSEDGAGDSPDGEVLNTIFRLFHSMKGSAGFMNLAVVQTVAHAAEDILSQVRQRQLALTVERIDLLIRTCDFLRGTMEQVQAAASDAQAAAESPALIQELKAALEDGAEAPADPAPAPAEPSPPAEPAPPPESAPAAAPPGRPPAPPTAPAGPDELPIPVPEAGDFAAVALEGARGELTALRNHPGRPEAWADLARNLNAFGQAVRALGYADCNALAGTLAGIAGQVRSGALAPSERHVTLLLKMLDVLEEALAAPEAEGRGDIPGLSVYLDLVEDTVGVVPTPAVPAPAPAGAAPAEAGTADLRSAFAAEATELLDEADQELLRLQQDPPPPEALDALLRLLHTFKGNCGVLGFAQPEQLSHAAETVAERLRDGAPALATPLTDLLLKITGVLRQAVEALEPTGAMEIQGLGVYLDLLADSAGPAPEQPAAAPESAGAPGPGAAPTAPAAPEPAPPPAAPTGANGGQGAPPATEPPPREAVQTQPAVQQDIRVRVEKVDVLLDLVGELFIAASMVTHHPDLAGQELEGFEKAARQLNKISRELHEITMSVRMVPISATFRKMRRVVHDLSRKSGKAIELKLVGEDTEMDKTVIELVSDPLVHMIRNAVDHGLEDADERVRAGKPAKGGLVLTASQEGGEVRITVEDDGRGLDRERILAKAVDRGLVRGNGGDLRDEEVFGLIFEPGFSTAREVTSISGRGVGMDVVRRNLEKIHGNVDIASTAGKGSRFTLRIPLTLAVVEGMLVRVGPTLYTIPTLAIRESLKVEPDRIVTLMDGQEYIRVRKDMFPVMRLHRIHKLTPTHQALTDGIILVLEHQNAVFCLFIDELLGMHQAVIKPLSSFMGKIRGLSGCAILGTGEVSLIVDVASLLEAADFPGPEAGGWAAHHFAAPAPPAAP